MSIATRVTFSHIRDTIRHMGRYNPPVLGRWALNTDTRVERVVRLANEDHCGTCGYSEGVSAFRKREMSNNDDILDFDYSFIALNTPN